MSVIATQALSLPRNAMRGTDLRWWWVLPAGLLAALGVLAVFVSSLAVPAADLAVARWVQGIHFFGWQELLALGERPTGSPEGILVWAALVFAFWSIGRPVEGAVLSVAPLVWFPQTLFEELVTRARPSADLLEVTSGLQGYSFPSGHITASMAVYGFLAVIVLVRLPRGRLRTTLLGLIAGLLILSAFSRVADGAHWPSDVLGAFLLGAAWLALLTWLYHRLRRDDVPLPGRFLLRRHGRLAAKVEPGVRHTRSIASTVYLDEASGCAVKVYRPSLPIRLLYWAAFQAPFPYSAREEALRTAAAIRRITGHLTQHWTGQDMVAPVCEIRCVRGELQFVTQLVNGREPENNAEIEPLLRALSLHFANAGLPTWQIDPENPHAHTNFIRTKDGALKIIDLESTLVPLIQPLNRLPQTFRMGCWPCFDDVDYARLHAYVETRRDALATSLGADGYADLLTAVEEAEQYSREWKSKEPNVWGRLAHRLWHWIDWDRRSAPVRGRLARSEEFALEFMTAPLSRWLHDGHLTAADAAEIRSVLYADETRGALRHLGAHVAISVPLRFPLGSIARFAMVLVFRYRAAQQFARGELDASAYHVALRTHTWLVAVVATIPGLGAGAYLLAPTLRRRAPTFAYLALDRALYRLPFHLYRRLRLHRLTARRVAAALHAARQRSLFAAPGAGAPAGSAETIADGHTIEPDRLGQQVA